MTYIFITLDRSSHFVSCKIYFVKIYFDKVDKYIKYDIVKSISVRGGHFLLYKVTCFNVVCVYVLLVPEQPAIGRGGVERLIKWYDSVEELRRESQR